MVIRQKKRPRPETEPATVAEVNGSVRDTSGLVPMPFVEAPVPYVGESSSLQVRVIEVPASLLVEVTLNQIGRAHV